jgi:membrane fusion protein, multidrug efflux system
MTTKNQMVISTKAAACPVISLFSHAVVLMVFLLFPLVAGAQQGYSDNRIRVQLTPHQQTTLSAEIAATVSKITLREGDLFKKDQLLLELDCALPNAQLKKTEANAEVARQWHKVCKRLEVLNSISPFEIDLATAKVKETEAECDAMKANVSKCSLVAPYDGRITKLNVAAHQHVTSGKPLMDIQDASSLEMRLTVPSDWLKWLKTGKIFSVHINELGHKYQARVIQLGSHIDTANQSLMIVGEIEGVHGELLPGMSGMASF